MQVCMLKTVGILRILVLMVQNLNVNINFFHRVKFRICLTAIRFHVYCYSYRRMKRDGSFSGYRKCRPHARLLVVYNTWGWEQQE